ncbi:MAG: hypothetical protein M1833_002826 [Piccolia ochrophora]|nr:MAG: hypothetical protein M1833_002826 [Piccolia ochrophora]
MSSYKEIANSACQKASNGTHSVSQRSDEALEITQPTHASERGRGHGRAPVSAKKQRAWKNGEKDRKKRCVEELVASVNL